MTMCTPRSREAGGGGVGRLHAGGPVAFEKERRGQATKQAAEHLVDLAQRHSSLSATKRPEPKHESTCERREASGWRACTEVGTCGSYIERLTMSLASATVCRAASAIRRTWIDGPRRLRELCQGFAGLVGDGRCNGGA